MNALLLEPATSPMDAEFARIVDQLTRRSFIGGALAATALAGISACGSGGTAASGQVDTRQVNTIHGLVDVPVQPQRVVAVSFIGTANLLDLGVTPVGGVTAGVDFLPQYRTMLDAMPIVADSAGKVELEKISSLNPDLIVGSDWPSATQALLPYDKLQKIAPTALVEQAPSVGNWADQARGYAGAVNQLDALAPLRQTFLETQERIRTTYADLLQGLRWEVVNAAQSGWYRYSTEASHCKVLAGAGCRFTAGASAQEKSFAQLSYEELGQLQSASALGLGRAVNPAWQTSLTGQELFRRLPAVEDGRLVNLTWFFPSSYGTAQALLNQVEPALAKWNDARPD